jgi:hypothetical protein
MNSIATNSIATNSTTKLHTLNVIENGLLLIKKNKEKHTILFHELNKIYIKKRKFNFLEKIGFSSFFLIIIAILYSYLPGEIQIIASILLIPSFVKINAYKRYQLIILLEDGNIFIKKINKDDRQEYIKMVTLVRKESFFLKISISSP